MCSDTSITNMRTFYFVVFLCLCLIHTNTGTLVSNGTNNTIVRKRSSYPSEVHLTHSERNRRLIPYATYYIASNHENAVATAAAAAAAANALYSSPVQHPDSGTGNNQEDEQEVKVDYVTTKSPIQKTPILINQQNAPYKYVNYQLNSVSDYNYVPIAYIPGNAAALPFTQSAPSQYHPAYVYPNEGPAESVKLYTTATPKYGSTTPKNPNSHNDNYHILRPSSLPKNVFLKYYVSEQEKFSVPAASPTISNNEMRKSTYTPILFSTPQSDYLTFRYSDLYRGGTHQQTPEYETSSPTTPVVEITSPKNYIVPHITAAPPKKYSPSSITSSTPSYSIAYEHPQAAQFAYAAPLPPAKIPQAKSIPPSYNVQSTQFTRTAPKTEEIPFHSKPSTYSIPLKQATSPKLYSEADISIEDIFGGYNLNKQLPERITPENIKDSIRTLSYILQMLQKADSITQFHNQPTLTYSKDLLDGFKDTHPLLQNEEPKTSVNSLQNEDTPYETYNVKEDLLHNKPNKDEQGTPGRAGIDYPIYSVIPETSFMCKTQRYKGFFADPETKCQVWHYCDLNGGQASFLCPNGTIFNQAALTCDWWFNVKCAATTQLYVLNERLYKYIIPIRPSFPEDFSGPLVDQYLTEKFKETESQRKYKYPTNSSSSSSSVTSTEPNLKALSDYEIPAHLLNENL